MKLSFVSTLLLTVLATNIPTHTRYHNYPQAKPTFHPCAHYNNTSYSPSSSTSQHMMLELANNPELGYNHVLASQVITFTQASWDNNLIQKIFEALAANPSLTMSDFLVQHLHHYYEHRCWTTEKHQLVKALAGNPTCGNDDRLVRMITTYVNQCWNNDKKEIVMLLAANPSTCHNFQLGTLMQKEMGHCYNTQKAEAIVTGVAGVCLLTIALIDWWCADTKVSPSPHYGSSHY